MTMTCEVTMSVADCTWPGSLEVSHFWVLGIQSRQVRVAVVNVERRIPRT